MKILIETLNRLVNNPVKSPQVKLQTIPPSRKEQLPRKIIKNFSTNNKILGDLFVHSYPTDSTNVYFKTEIANRFGKPIASELYQIIPSNRNIYGYQMVTNEEYRQKGYRLGEILRLSSVIEMIENCSRYLKITASKSAVYFHAKYKFQPDIQDSKEAQKILSSIIQDKSAGFLDIKKEAYKTLNCLRKNSDNYPELRNLLKKTNSIVAKYIQKALESPEPQKKHPFKEALPMILTDKNVYKNKDFFNKLLESHKIEYRI